MRDACREQLRRHLPHLLVRHIHRKTALVCNAQPPERRPAEVAKVRDVRPVRLRQCDLQITQPRLHVLVLVIKFRVQLHAARIRLVKGLVDRLLRDPAGLKILVHHLLDGRLQDLLPRRKRHRKRLLDRRRRLPAHPAQIVLRLLRDAVHRQAFINLRRSLCGLFLCQSRILLRDPSLTLRHIGFHLCFFLDVDLRKLPFCPHLRNDLPQLFQKIVVGVLPEVFRIRAVHLLCQRLCLADALVNARDPHDLLRRIFDSGREQLRQHPGKIGIQLTDARPALFLDRQFPQRCFIEIVVLLDLSRVLLRERDRSFADGVLQRRVLLGELPVELQRAVIRFFKDRLDRGPFQRVVFQKFVHQLQHARAHFLPQRFHLRSQRRDKIVCDLRCKAHKLVSVCLRQLLDLKVRPLRLGVRFRHRIADIRIIPVKRSDVIRRALDLIAVECNSFRIQNQAVKICSVYFIEKLDGRDHIPYSRLVYVIKHCKVVFSINAIQNAVYCRIVSIVLKAIILIFSYCFQKFSHLPACDCSFLRRQRIPDIQIIGPYITILLCVAFAIRKIESAAIQIGIFGFLPVKNVERLISATVHDFWSPVRIHDLACRLRLVLPIAKPTLELLRLCYIFNGHIDF